MRLASIFGLFLACGILLLAIPQLDTARGAITAVAPASMSPWLAILIMFGVGLGAFFILFTALFRVLRS
jgi:hypothetical protein